MTRCLPLESTRICINGIRGKMNLPFKGVKFKHCGFIGNPIFLALELTGYFHYFGLIGK